MTYLNEVPNARDAAHTRLLLLGVGAHQPGSQVVVVGVGVGVGVGVRVRVRVRVSTTATSSLISFGFVLRCS